MAQTFKIRKTVIELLCIRIIFLRRRLPATKFAAEHDSTATAANQGDLGLVSSLDGWYGFELDGRPAEFDH